MAYFKARVGGSGGNKEEIIWQNTSPTSSIGDLTVDCDFSKYRYVLIKARVSTSSNAMPSVFGCYIDDSFTYSNITLCYIMMGVKSGTYYTKRIVSALSGGTQLKIAVDESSFTVYNIPIEIIGILK